MIESAPHERLLLQACERHDGVDEAHLHGLLGVVQPAQEPHFLGALGADQPRHLRAAVARVEASYLCSGPPPTSSYSRCVIVIHPHHA